MIFITYCIYAVALYLCAIYHSYWDSRVVNTSSSTVVTPVNDHPAVAAGHYGAFLGDTLRLPVVFIAAVPTILPSLTPPTLLLVTCGTMPPLPGSAATSCPSWLLWCFFALAAMRSLLGRPWWTSLNVAALAAH